jgi:deoxyribose-phosphate aldolase
VSTTPLRLVTAEDRDVQIASSIAVPVIENEAQLKALIASLSGVDAVGAEARAAKLSTRSIKKSTKLAAIDLAISMIDLTTLEGADTPGRVTSLCTKAMRPDPRDLAVPSVAAVCVYPDLVAHARSVLGSSPVAVASVATAFPSGRASINVKLMDVREAVAAGADRSTW